jgi:hypothetical protein
MVYDLVTMETTYPAQSIDEDIKGTQSELDGPNQSQC